MTHIYIYIYIYTLSCYCCAWESAGMGFRITAIIFCGGRPFRHLTGPSCFLHGRPGNSCCESCKVGWEGP